MVSSFRVACVGFSGFERDTLEAYFRLASRPRRDETGAPSPSCVLVGSATQAGLLLVDGDLPGAEAQARRTHGLPDCIFIGGPGAPAGAAAWLPRPVDAIQVKRTLDEVNKARAQRLAEKQLQRHGAQQLGLSARLRQWMGSGLVVSDFHHSKGFSNSVLTDGEPRLGRVLVVTDSPAERRLLHGWLTQVGYRVSVASSGEDALSAAQRRRWQFIFLGLAISGMDAFQTCRRLKRAHPADARGRPAVVVLCPKARPVDQIRASFSGCDALLMEPFGEEDLLQLLARHDSTFERVFEPTAPLAL